MLVDNDATLLDSARNMIALNPLLRRWWRKGKLAFQPLSKRENGIRVCLRWLPRSKIGCSASGFGLSIDLLDQLEVRQEIKILNFESFRAIHDEETIDIVSDDPESRVDWDLMQLQWEPLRICALSGAVDRPDELIPGANNDNDGDDSNSDDGNNDDGNNDDSTDGDDSDDSWQRGMSRVPRRAYTDFC